MTTKRYVKGRLYELALSDVQVDAAQPRKHFDEQALQELKASIQEHGVLQPVLVRPGEGGAFVLVSGERRYQASLQAGLATIPALLTEGDPAEISIVENLLREGLTPIEEAEAIAQLKETHSYELNDLSRVLGKAQSTLSEILSLNRLPQEIKDDCRHEPGASRKLLLTVAKQATVTKMKALYRRYKVSGLTCSELKTRQRAKTAGGGNDLTFVRRFSQRLETLQPGNLDSGQTHNLITELEELRTLIKKKTRALKAQPQ